MVLIGNEVYKGWLSNPDGSISSKATFLAGLGAGATEAVAVVTPMEVVKIRLQAQQRKLDDANWKEKHSLSILQTRWLIPSTFHDTATLPMLPIPLSERKESLPSIGVSPSPPSDKRQIKE